VRNIRQVIGPFRKKMCFGVTYASLDKPATKSQHLPYDKRGDRRLSVRLIFHMSFRVPNASSRLPSFSKPYLPGSYHFLPYFYINIEYKLFFDDTGHNGS